MGQHQEAAAVLTRADKSQAGGNRTKAEIRWGYLAISAVAEETSRKSPGTQGCQHFPCPAHSPLARLFQTTA